jgi:hypothetical protein
MVEIAGGLFVACGPQGALGFRLAMREPVSGGLRFLQLPGGPFAEQPKIDDIAHRDRPIVIGSCKRPVCDSTRGFQAVYTNH